MAADGSVTGTCPYCGYEQTLPKLGTADRQDLYERAGKLRLGKKYHDALRLYQSALENDNSDPETHWLALLCRYEVEYADDPLTSSRVIKCNKILRKSILADDDYAACLANATDYSRHIYEAEAIEIDRIQMEELAIIDGRKDFDVFVSFKQKDAQGRITKDCLRAEQIYNALTDEGYKVFFSKVTLEDRLGFSWASFIDDALDSAKIMVAVGTSKDNYDARWVKYEWSRFLELVGQDPFKRFIPAYEDMNASDLPDEFASFQAVNMADANYIYSLVRNVRNLIGVAPDYEPQLAASTDVNVENTTVPFVLHEYAASAAPVKIPQIVRAFQMCEDGEFDEAKKQVDDVLATIDAESGDAFLVRLMVEFECRHEEDLSKLTIDDLTENRNYHRAYEFGDEHLKIKLEGYNQQAKENYNLPPEVRAKRFEDSLDNIKISFKGSQILSGWRMLSIDDEHKRVLVISHDCIADMPYHQPGGDITWENCTLREWLNGEFYNSILPEAIKQRVVEWDIPSHDKVSLLSVDEAREYFVSSTDRVATFEDKTSWWWLRSPGNRASYAAFVGGDGSVHGHGSFVDNSSGVRPALWLSL